MAEGMSQSEVVLRVFASIVILVCILIIAWWLAYTLVLHKIPLFRDIVEGTRDKKTFRKPSRVD
eukprot:m.25902 g.25902  ORF g.25902 m.25902 type:complete len:64 (-) comp11439_c0_seq1:99-290(-)